MFFDYSRRITIHVVITKNSGMEDSILVLFLLSFCVCGIQTAVSDEGCTENTITLKDGFTGQLKFCKGGWGAVCSFHKKKYKFTQVDSQVVCYELGYSGDGANFTIGHNNIPKNYIALAGVHCQGDEERLSECSKTGGHIYQCKDTNESVYVTCSKESQVRLHNYQDNKLQDYRGVVEHWYNGSWHVLCDTGEWTLKDSQVVCWQLGLGKAVEHSYKCEGSIESLDYFQNNIHCQNDEKMIKKCRIEKHWNISPTCNDTSTVVNMMCEGPVVQDITITSSASESVTLSWKLPQNFNKAVVTEFRVEYWPEGHKSQKRRFDQSSDFSYATLDFLEPDTTYEMVIVPMMGEHPGNNSTSKVHSVKTGKNPVIVGLKGNITGLEGEIKELKGSTIGLSSVLVVISIIIVIAIILKIGRFIQRKIRRCGYQNIPNGNGGQPLRVNGDVYFDARDGR